MLQVIKLKHLSIALLYLILAALFLVTLAYWTVPEGKAQENDAIAIQVRKNFDRFSALRWYTDVKNFEGAPQALIVDGYEAIRDGRTVYVNAGNIGSNGQFHANIYLISYSEGSAPDTVLVFNDMLKRWTFNTNMTNPGDYGTCSISTISCLSDNDCQNGYECRPDNKCHLFEADENKLTCWRDKNCPEGLFCSGGKAALTRQTKRYANLADIKVLLEEYYDKNGYYPSLSSGSYVAGVTISTWESWNNTLGAQIGAADLPLDPINVMGVCGGGNYDPDTCWDDVNKTYAGSFDASGVATGPAEGSFYGYSATRVYSYSPDDESPLELVFDN